MSATLSPPPADPTMPTPDDAGGPPDADDNVVCTIAKDGQGGYVVYPGDEPEGGGAGGGMDDGSEDDADALGPAGDMPAGGNGGGMGDGATPAPQGQPASSIGEALKLALGIMQADQSSQPPSGSPDDQFSAGFGGSQGAAPAASLPQKY